ncbi:MAG: hypothetical protein SGJ27_08595 [Candidatus Melainabacteria bacterium]|nr:hypothetical protein [Candidatus Melainabacteria bacterium]
MPEKNKQDKVFEDLTKVAESVISDVGLLLVSIAIVQQGKRRVLNIAIHRKGGRVSLDDCETVSRRLEAALDERAAGELGPVLDGDYVLDVESPGIDRVLKTDTEYRVFEGETVEVRLKESIDGMPHNIKGTLAGLIENENAKTVLIKNPASLEQSKTSKSSKSKGKAEVDEAASKFKEEVALPFASIYSVRLYPEHAIKALSEAETETDSDDDADIEIEAEI